MDAQHTKHVTYTLAYHFVWCPNYRKKILVEKLATCVEQEIRDTVLKYIELGQAYNGKTFLIFVVCSE